MKYKISRHETIVHIYIALAMPKELLVTDFAWARSKEKVIIAHVTSG